MVLFQLLSVLRPALPWLLAVTGIFLYFVYKHFAIGKKPVPPGPSGVKLFFEILKALKGGTLHLLGEKWARQYGDIVMCRTIIGNLCFLNSARLVRQVFTDKGTELVTNDRPPSYTGAVLAYNFKIVGLSDGVKLSDWSKMRKLFHSTLKFYGSGVETFEVMLRAELCRLTEALETEIKLAGGNDRQLPECRCDLEMESFVPISIRRVLATLITGEAHGPDSKVPQLVGDWAVCLQKIISPTTDYLLFTFPFLRFLPGTYYKELCDRTHKCRDAFMEEVFTKAKANHVPGKPKGMLGALFDEQVNNSSDWLTDDHIRGMMIDIVIAGYATSTELLKGFFLFMAHHPQAMKRIQQEIDKVLGLKAPSLNDRKSLPFIEAAILEVLRMVSTIPLSLGHETRDDVVTNGFCIPKGTIQLGNIWWMNRDPTAWEEPDVFRPERFLDNEGQLLPPTHPTRWRLLPFGVGRRSCPGESFARSRAFLYVTTLLQKFDFLPPVNHDLLPLTQDSWTEGVVLQLKPYYVAIQRRSQ
ncbi:cytochrome P450 2J6-like [Pomacea canaliculata]|uniref:cytochrome P450 2J6-like n=1 Tax=Pomacea canaliculata TaxID=400727 RepID=UPI000D72B014|nr:cytochrome P450 2J6-like [Pomacea canaliculata]